MNGLTCFISKFLNTDDIDKIAQGNKIINPYYLGCYPADVKPDGVETNDCCCWVWNVDEQDKSGSHWVCVVKKRKNIIFFDSYGKTPTFFKWDYWLDYFRELGCTFRLYTNIQFQSYISRTCGTWCLVF
jgi:hypothetical protein